MRLARRIHRLDCPVIVCAVFFLSSCGWKPTDADYCTVLLVPSLAEELGLDIETRISLAHQGSELVHYLGGSKTAPYTPDTDIDPGPIELTEALGVSRLQAEGRKTKKLLTPEVSDQFDLLFEQRKVHHVTYRIKEAPSESEEDQYVLAYGWSDMPTEHYESDLDKLQSRLYRGYGVVSTVEQARGLLGSDIKIARSAARNWLYNNGFSEEARQSLQNNDERSRSSESQRAVRQRQEEQNRESRESFKQRRRQKQPER